MENKNKTEGKTSTVSHGVKERLPTIKFENSKTYGDEIKALVSFFTDRVGSNFVLSEALRQVDENEEAIAEFRSALLKEVNA